MVAENECLKNEEGPFPRTNARRARFALGQTGGIGGCTIPES